MNLYSILLVLPCMHMRTLYTHTYITLERLGIIIISTPPSLHQLMRRINNSKLKDPTFLSSIYAGPCSERSGGRSRRFRQKWESWSAWGHTRGVIGIFFKNNMVRITGQGFDPIGIDLWYKMYVPALAGITSYFMIDVWLEYCIFYIHLE